MPLQCQEIFPTFRVFWAQKKRSGRPSVPLRIFKDARPTVMCFSITCYKKAGGCPPTRFTLPSSDAGLSRAGRSAIRARSRAPDYLSVGLFVHSPRIGQAKK